MVSLKEISDLKSIYDFLEIRKEVVSENPDQFENYEFDRIMTKQKMVFKELYHRLEEISEFKDLII